VVEGTVNKVTGNTLDQIGLADHFDEILSAIITGLIQNVLYGGLSNQSGSSSNGSLLFDAGIGQGSSEEVTSIANAFIEQVDIGIRVEERVRNAKLQSLSEIETAQDNLSRLASCWEGKLVGGQSLTLLQETDARNNAINASSTRLALEPRRIPLKEAADSQERRITEFDAFRTRAFAVKSLQEVQTLSTEFFRFQGANGSGPSGLLDAEAELTQTRTDMEALNTTTSEKLTQCHAFPPTNQN
jgi:hypothetical protein